MNDALCFLNGDNPDYPEQILSESYGQVCRRLELIRQDEADLTQVNIHHWQQLNPVLTEALVQLTLGAPQIIYNGGLLMCSVRYYDAQSRRPGLPPDVAALVEKVGPRNVTIQMVNLNLFESRQVLLQAGGFGEHQFEAVHYNQRLSSYPGAIDSYAAPALETESRTVPINDKYLEVRMPPATEIRLELSIKRSVNTPSYASPWVDGKK